ncbi:MAG: phosphatase PAP2 family protein [Gemmatimonadaceae bacterium]|nr:phosphatase PAP2 family protein [Gemmatimonadaceae bacterium]
MIAAWRYLRSAPAPVRGLAFLAAAAFVTFVPMLGDRWAYDAMFSPRVYDQDWARLLRLMGWYPTWMLAALAILLAGRAGGAACAPGEEVGPRARGAAAWSAGARSLYMLLAPAVSGIACEVLKLVIRRQRPEVHAGAYGFRPWSDQPFSTAGLATPSSHAMVAFAAATALARLFPGARWLWYALAAGCAITRVMAHAHFVSDVALGALLGWALGWATLAAMRRSETKGPGVIA